MKIKTDFVTNSSTTSFIGWGVYLSEDELMKNEVFIKKCFEIYKDSQYSDKDITIEKFKENTYNIIDNFNSKVLNISGGPFDSGDFMIAGGPSRMKDDQTLKEFKQQIIGELKEFGIEVNDLTWIAEAWRDG